MAKKRSHSATAQRYRQSMWGRIDRALRNCFAGSAILGVVILIAVFLAPAPPPPPSTVDEVPERFARLILEKPKPKASTIEAPEQAKVAEAPKAEVPPPKAKPKPPPRRRLDNEPRVAKDKGAKGRQKAQREVTQNLSQVTGSLDKVLDNLSKSLPASEKPAKENDKGRSSRRRRGVRSGRSSQQLSPVQGDAATTAPDVAASAIVSDGISIAAIADLSVQGVPGGAATSPGGGGSGNGRSGGGEYRSNESLLSVVRRYAPGIQFCYDNELKKNPGLRGKLVVSLTVLANGGVSDATIVENSLRSPAVTQCVLSQIRGWQFPAIPHGATSFKTPFVFTPPD